MYSVIAFSAIVAVALADSVRYQVSLTPINYGDNTAAFTATGAARLVTVNLALENCAQPTPEQPCGWGLARSVNYGAHEEKNFYSGGQRNAFGVKKADNLAGFWADASMHSEDLPGDLITAEKDLRVEYGNFDRRFKTPKTLVNGIHQGSSPIYVSGDMDLVEGGNFGACFRLFDNSPADRPNSFDLIATGAFASGKPSSVDSDVVYGFWGNGVVGRVQQAEADKFFNSAAVKPVVAEHADDLAAVKAVLGSRSNVALEGVEQKYAQPVFGVNGADIANDEESVSGFAQTEESARRVAVWPLVYKAAGNGLNDRVQQACALNDAGECVFRPVAYATATPCDFGVNKRAVEATNYFQ